MDQPIGSRNWKTKVIADNANNNLIIIFGYASVENKARLHQLFVTRSR